MKQNQSVKPIINIDANTVTFEVRGHETLILDMSKLHPSIVAKAALVGMAQVRIVDAAAVGVADGKGNIRTPAQRDEMKWHRMNDLISHYHSGTEEWNTKRAAAGERESTSAAIVAQALGRVRNIDQMAAVKLAEKLAEVKFAGDLKATYKFLASDAQIAKAILAIRAESIKSTVDVSGALDDLESTE